MHSYFHTLIKPLVETDRRYKQSLAVLADLLTVWLVAWGAFSIRLGPAMPLTSVQWGLIAVTPVIAVPWFIWTGLYRSIIRFVGEHALLSIAQAVVLSALTWVALGMATRQLGLAAGLPLSVPILFAVMLFASISASRFFARWILWKSQRSRFSGRQALIYGAGAHGRQIAQLLRHGVEFFPAGFIDDSADLAYKDVDGIRVYPISELSRLIRQFEISDVILSSDAFKIRSRREIMRQLSPFPVHIRLVPSLIDSTSNQGKAGLAITEVDPVDLLDREPYRDLAGSLKETYRDAVVLVTGAAGSIGSEICRRVIREQPRKLVLLDNSEAGLYQIHLELSEYLSSSDANPAVLLPVIADVRDSLRVQHVFQESKPNFVFHAAAYKHVHLVERHPSEGVNVNVFGTRNCMLAAAKAGVDRFLLISSDKAVYPASVMGVTKRLAELLILETNREVEKWGNKTIYAIVRFGNVLDSSGSVIPLFRRQIAAGGPVTVTHPEVTRYFMTIPQAAALVLKSVGMARDRDVFVLDMGPPVRILDIAKRMIRFSGLRVLDESNPEGDIEIIFTGLKPGEKLHEELAYDILLRPTEEPGITCLSKEESGDLLALDFQLRALEKSCKEQDNERLIRILGALAIGFRSRSQGLAQVQSMVIDQI